MLHLHSGVEPPLVFFSLCCLLPLFQCMWTGFGVVWDLAALGLIDTHTEEVAYLCCDFSAKVRRPGRAGTIHKRH